MIRPALCCHFQGYATGVAHYCDIGREIPEQCDGCGAHVHDPKASDKYREESWRVFIEQWNQRTA